MAHISGFDAGEIIDQAHAQTGPHEPKRAKAQRASLIRNRVILERLGCIDEAGMIKLRKGNAPTITNHFQISSFPFFQTCVKTSAS
jgi:hypothetical protein